MDGIFMTNWATQVRKGVLELGVLNAISAGKIYGYDIVRKLRAVDGLVISEGTIYPILSRLKREGLVSTAIEESSQGPARKYYQLTDQGQRHLDTMNSHWLSIAGGIASLRKESKP